MGFKLSEEGFRSPEDSLISTELSFCTAASGATYGHSACRRKDLYLYYASLPSKPYSDHLRVRHSIFKVTPIDSLSRESLQQPLFSGSKISEGCAGPPDRPGHSGNDRRPSRRRGGSIILGLGFRILRNSGMISYGALGGFRWRYSICCSTWLPAKRIPQKPFKQGWGSLGFNRLTRPALRDTKAIFASVS